MIYVSLGGEIGQWDEGLEFQDTMAKSGFTISFDFIVLSP